MEIRREIQLGLALLVFLVLLVSFGAIGLLWRIVQVAEETQRTGAAETAALDEARRLGTAGAWAAVFLGFAGFAAGLLVLRRLQRRVLAPLLDLSAVAADAEDGGAQRRCREMAAPAPLSRIMKVMNELLDRSARSVRPPEGGLAQSAALVHFLDSLKRPALVVDQEGGIAASSRRALEQLRGEDGDELRQQLRRVPRGETGAALATVEKLRDGAAWLCELHTSRPR